MIAPVSWIYRQFRIGAVENAESCTLVISHGTGGNWLAEMSSGLTFLLQKQNHFRPANGPNNELLTLDSRGQLGQPSDAMQGRCKIPQIKTRLRTTTWIPGRRAEKHKICWRGLVGGTVSHTLAAWLLWAQRDISFRWHSLRRLKGWITRTDGWLLPCCLLAAAPKIIYDFQGWSYRHGMLMQPTVLRIERCWCWSCGLQMGYLEQQKQKKACSKFFYIKIAKSCRILAQYVASEYTPAFQKNERNVSGHGFVKIRHTYIIWRHGIVHKQSERLKKKEENVDRRANK